MTMRSFEPAELTAARVLVVAPHPDDEALGCGGLLWHLARLGREIHVVFVTDGGASHQNSPTWPRPRLAAQREREAGEALRLLGLADAPRSFLRLRDADMPAAGSPEEKQSLHSAAGIVAGFSPDLVILPWRRDPHRDHRDSWRLFMQVIRESPIQPDVLEYAIWLDEFGAPEDHPRENEMETIHIGIGAAITAKREAVLAHRTQVGEMITDDPTAFRLTAETIDRLVGPSERYLRPRP